MLPKSSGLTRQVVSHGSGLSKQVSMRDCAFGQIRRRKFTNICFFFLLSVPPVPRLLPTCPWWWTVYSMPWGRHASSPSPTPRSFYGPSRHHGYPSVPAAPSFRIGFWQFATFPPTLADRSNSWKTAPQSTVRLCCMTPSNIWTMKGTCKPKPL